METYSTVSGDTWDMIAKAVYGEERYAALLMEANPKLLDYFVFPEGIILVIPEVPEESADMPDWRS